MNTPFAPWQAQAYQLACSALDSGRLGHALLFTGPAHIGKRAVVERLAQRMVCEAPQADGNPCGVCRACSLYLHRVEEDAVALRPDGSPAHPYGRPGHPDVQFIGHALNDKTGKTRSEIVIEQVRTLSDALTLTAHDGRAQVVVIDPAEAMNTAAANALLKTLEEPQPGRHLWLIAAEPARLPATIRSRCQRIALRLPTMHEALQWLLTQGHAPAAAQEALHAAQGHPGLAHAWLSHAGLATRRAVLGDLTALASGRVAAHDVAKQWVDEGDAALRLRFAADIALDEARRLTSPPRTRRLTQWFGEANRVRDLLRTTVRADLAIAELLLDWPAPPTGERPR